MPTAPRSPAFAEPLVTARLLDWRPDAYQYIASRVTPPVTRQHVRRVAMYLDGYPEGRPSPRIEKAIKHALRFRRYP